MELDPMKLSNLATAHQFSSADLAIPLDLLPQQLFLAKSLSACKSPNPNLVQPISYNHPLHSQQECISNVLLCFCFALCSRRHSFHLMLCPVALFPSSGIASVLWCSLHPEALLPPGGANFQEHTHARTHTAAGGAGCQDSSGKGPYSPQGCPK
eukprot:scaffold5534_cov16-Tisochrysis_lutea.AAC.1